MLNYDFLGNPQLNGSCIYGYPSTNYGPRVPKSDLVQTLVWSVHWTVLDVFSSLWKLRKWLKETWWKLRTVWENDWFRTWWSEKKQNGMKCQMCPDGNKGNLLQSDWQHLECQVGHSWHTPIVRGKITSLMDLDCLVCWGIAGGRGTREEARRMENRMTSGLEGNNQALKYYIFVPVSLVLWNCCFGRVN